MRSCLHWTHLLTDVIFTVITLSGVMVSQPYTRPYSLCTQTLCAATNNVVSRMVKRLRCFSYVSRFGLKASANCLNVNVYVNKCYIFSQGHLIKCMNACSQMNESTYFNAVYHLSL